MGLMRKGPVAHTKELDQGRRIDEKEKTASGTSITKKKKKKKKKQNKEKKKKKI